MSKAPIYPQDDPRGMRLDFTNIKIPEKAREIYLTWSGNRWEVGWVYGKSRRKFMEGQTIDGLRGYSYIALDTKKFEIMLGRLGKVVWCDFWFSNQDGDQANFTNDKGQNLIVTPGPIRTDRI